MYICLCRSAHERLMGRNAAKSMSDSNAIRTLERDVNRANRFFDNDSPTPPYVFLLRCWYNLFNDTYAVRIIAA